jgi:galactonate dehydratase
MAGSAGCGGVKGNPFESRRHPMDMAAVDLSGECVAATRAATGHDPAIMLDAHGSPSFELSIKYAQRVAPYNPLFIEEPCKVGSIDALIAVSQASPVPIATGKKLFTIREFDEIIQRRAGAYLQPDITHCYGISAFMEISANAPHQQMLLAPHNVAARSAAPQPFTLSPPSPLS